LPVDHCVAETPSSEGLLPRLLQGPGDDRHRVRDLHLLAGAELLRGARPDLCRLGRRGRRVRGGRPRSALLALDVARVVLPLGGPAPPALSAGALSHTCLGQQYL